MTANHLAVMADNGQKVAVVTPHAASPMQGVVVKRGNETIDLAIIDVGQNVFAPFTFRTDSPAVGEELWIMGYGAGSVHPSAMHGIVSSSYDDLFDSLFPRIVTDAQGQHGHSGSPVLDRNGYVIGVLTQILRNGGQTSFAVPGTIAAKFAELR
jgi:S1-C subfamily serine protease